MPEVQVGEQRYRVQFVHSSHNPKEAAKTAHPGGLRQYIDNLARSLQRRVSFAEVSLLVSEPNPESTRRNPLPDLEIAQPVSQGFAVCHNADTFVKNEGRDIALQRAIDLSGLPKDVKNALSLAAAGVELHVLRERIRARHMTAAMQEVDRETARLARALRRNSVNADSADSAERVN